MGDTPLGATSWADAGHRLGGVLREALDAGHAFLVVSESGGRYVQLHAHPDGGCWVEADSGAYSTPLAEARHRTLLGLGWPPTEGEQQPTSNYGFDVIEESPSLGSLAHPLVGPAMNASGVSVGTANGRRPPWDVR